jgi:hypothetical protein
LFLIIVNVLGHPKGVGGLTSYLLRGGGMGVFWNDPLLENSASLLFDNIFHEYFHDQFCCFDFILTKSVRLVFCIAMKYPPGVTDILSCSSEISQTEPVRLSIQTERNFHYKNIEITTQ